jgi:hypothetical protein
MSASFLSPDSYIQDPTTQQGFNRYAYCAYNPLKYVDPSGYRYYGYDEGAYYRMIDEMTRTIQREWHLVYESAMESAQLTISMACGLYSHGLDTHGNGSGNHGSPGGGGQNGPNNKPLIFIRSYITDNDSPIYQFVIYNTDESSGNNTSYFSELKKFAEENTKYFFIDGAAALDFIYENSFDENMNPYKEISVWVANEGIIVQPWYNNTATESINSFTKIDDDYFYKFDGHMYKIEAQVHTHLNYNNGDIGVSKEDMGLDTIIPVYIIYNSSLYKAGNPAIMIDQIRNINYYNWKNYFKY